MDDRMTGESPHELLLALAGRIDDDLLAWCRELVAVGEDARALELITATLIADRTPLPPSVRTALVGATRTARTDLDADSALAPATTDDGTAHRFDTELPGAHNLAAAVGALPTRQIAGCRSWVTMRTTPAGSAPGPLPQPVVLVEVGAGDTRPVDIMAYQLAIACARTGVPAAVEVVVAGTDRPAYHETALASAIAVHGADEPVVDGSVPAPPVEPAPELLSPGSPDTLFAETMHAETTLADTGPVPVGSEAPRPFPRRAAREDDDAGAAFRAAAATSGVRSAPEPFESSLFASAPPAQPLDARPLDEGLFDPGPADQPPAAASVAGPPGAESPVTDASTVGRAAPPVSGPSDAEATDPGTTEPGPTDPQATDPGPTDPGASDPRATHPGASDPGTSELPRRPRPVTALRGLSQPTPRPTPVRPSAVTPMPRPQPGRRGNLSPVAEPAAVRDQPEVPSAHTPAFAFLGDPLDGPVEDRPTPLDGRGEPMIDANDPLGLGLLPVPAPEVPGPPAEPVSDSWLADWITGDWAMSPSALDGPPAGDRPAEPFPGPEAGSAVPEIRTAGPRPSPRPEPTAGPDPTRTGRRRAADAVREPSPEATVARTGRPRPSPVAPPAAPRPASAHPAAAAAHPVAQRPAAPRPSVAEPPAIEPPAVEPPTVRPSAVEPPAVQPSAVQPPAVEPSAVEPPESSLEQTGFVLRPESVARLSEADRELLARLQAELAGTPRPRVTRRAGIGGTNGSAAPPDMAG